MLEFYGLREQPFGTTPDPRFLFPLPSMSEAMASLACGIEYRVGFAALIADPGMGKTTILVDLLSRFSGKVQSAFIFNTQCSGAALLQQIAEDLGVPAAPEISQTHNNLKNHFATHGSEIPVLVVIDEAQNLDEDALEAVRLLSDCETTDRKLLHIILAGQPQLTAKLQDPNLLQLEQRITMITRLERLSAEQTAAYIQHRMRVAGGDDGTFGEEAIQTIARQSHGIPREINRLCFNALLLGHALAKRVIDQEIIDEVIADLELPKAERAKYVHDESRVVTMGRRIQEPPVVEHVKEEIPTLSFKTGTDGSSDLQGSTLPWLLRMELAQANRTRASRPAVSANAPPETAPVTASVPSSATERQRIPVVTREVETNGSNVRLILSQLDSPEATQLRLHVMLFGGAILLAVVLGVIWSSARSGASAYVSQGTTQSATGTQDKTESAVTARGKDSRDSLARRKVRAKAERRPAGTEQKVLADSSNESVKLLPQISPPSAAGASQPMPQDNSTDRVEAKVVQKTQPQYPPAAKAKHVEGAVRLNVTVGTDGKVKMVRVESGNPLFLRDAVKAVREWVYEPATLNGQRITSQLPVTVQFHLDNQETQTP